MMYAAGAADKMVEPAQQAIGAKHRIIRHTRFRARMLFEEEGVPCEDLTTVGAELASVTLGKSNAKILSTAENRLSKVSIAPCGAETADSAAEMWAHLFKNPHYIF